jgi:uncharacterized protein involved in exopolysaccharide biosynthesis
MNEVQTTPLDRAAQARTDEVSVIDLIIALAKHKRLVIGLPVIVAVLAVGISFILPKTYKASTKLLPPQQAQSGAAALLSQLGGVAGMAAGAAGIKNPSDMYIGMLKSRTVADKLIAQYNLKKGYETESQESARARLEADTVITSGKDGLITIEVENRDQKLVAKLANSYVEQLLQLTKVLALTEASQRRMFYERQLEGAKDNLTRAEMSLKGALDSRGVISVDAESRAVLETVGRLKAQVSAKEIQLGSMRAFLTPNNPQYKRTEEELSSLRSELSRLENGRAGGEVAADGANANASKPGGFENIKLLRDVKYYQMLYELLAKQYEVARLDEAKDPSIIQVLDPAVEPERKFKPRRAVIVMLSTVVAFFLAVFAAFVLEARRKLSPENAAQWDELKAQLRRKQKSVRE